MLVFCLLVVSCNVLADPPLRKWAYLVTDIGDRKIYIDTECWNRDKNIVFTCIGLKEKDSTTIEFVWVFYIDVQYNTYKEYSDVEWSEIQERSTQLAAKEYIQQHWKEIVNINE
jgi:uncharacterized protein YbdZ (MbtH family)